MNAQIDPYFDWLQIPADRRPPTHYELLGLPAFEGDAARLQAAATRRIAHVRKYQVGVHSDLAIRVMGEISRALTCLLEPASRDEYDAQLRGMTTLSAMREPGMETVLEKRKSESGAVRSSAGSVSPTVEDTYAIEPLPAEMGGSFAGPSLDKLSALVEIAEASPSGGAIDQGRIDAATDHDNRFLFAVVASVVGVLLLISGGWALFGSKEDRNATSVAEAPAEDQSAKEETVAEQSSASSLLADPQNQDLAAGQGSAMPPFTAPEPRGAGVPSGRGFTPRNEPVHESSPPTQGRPSAVGSESRVWRNAMTRQRVRATFVSLIDGRLMLKHDDSMTGWPMEHSSTEDHAYVASLVGEDYYHAHKSIPPAVRSTPPAEPAAGNAEPAGSAPARNTIQLSNSFKRALAEVDNALDKTARDRNADVGKWRQVVEQLDALARQVNTQTQFEAVQRLRKRLANLAEDRVEAAIKQKNKSTPLFEKFLQEAAAMDPNGETGKKARDMLTMAGQNQFGF